MMSFSKIKRYQVVCAVAAVLWTMFIWGNSLQPAVASSEQSQSVVDLLQPLLNVLGIPSEEWQHLIRKAAHMFEFFMLALFWSGVFSGKKRILVLGLCFATACMDEGLQYFVPGRSNQLTDVLIDFSGAVLAVILYYVVQRLRHTRMKK